jgi:mono/diheme cytochrome c family protein
LTGQEQILIAGLSCLVLSVLAAGAASRCLPGNANSGSSFPVRVPSKPTPDQARGKRLFEGQCGRCHGMQGGGGTGANLRRSKLRHADNDDSLSDDGRLEEKGNHPQQQPCQDGLGMEPEGTGNVGFVAGALPVLPQAHAPGIRAALGVASELKYRFL